MVGLLLGLCDLGALILLVVLPMLWIFAPVSWMVGTRPLTLAWHIWWYALPALLFASRCALRRWVVRREIGGRALWENSWFRKLVFTLLMAFLFFDLLEVTLAKISFAVQLPDIVFEGKDAHGKILIADVESDPFLLWRFAPGSKFNGRKINQMGFREREVQAAKPSGTRRVVCFGDSVTAQGRPCYSEYLHRLLSTDPPTNDRWEAFNMAVYGYSSAQGLRLFEMTKDRVQPDIVTLYFGWNDHWRNSRTDYQLMALKMRPFTGHLMDALQHKRFFQLLLWLTDWDGHIRQKESSGRFQYFHGTTRSAHEAWDTSTLRLSPQEYRATLTRFVHEIRAANAIPLLITAPRRHLSENVVIHNYAHSVAVAEQLHDEYVEITRAVARDTHAELLDLASIMAAPVCDAFFRPDGIHFDYCEQEENMLNDPPSQPGLQRIATELDRKIHAITHSLAWQEKVARDHHE